MATIIAMTVYAVAGCIISAPYTYLAGGNFDNFFWTAMFAPAAAGLLFLAYIMDTSENRLRKGLMRQLLGGIFFWSFATYLCLPIILNGASHLIAWQGHEEAGRFVSSLRYLMLLILPVAFFVIVGFIDMVESIWKDLDEKPQVF